MLGPNFPELVYNELGRSPGPGTGPAPGSRPPEHESLVLALVRPGSAWLDLSIPGQVLGTGSLARTHTGRGYLLVSSQLWPGHREGETFSQAREDIAKTGKFPIW